MIEKKEEFIKLSGEQELKKEVFKIERFIRKITASIIKIPKNEEGLEKSETLKKLYEKAIELLQEIYKKDEKEIFKEIDELLKKEYPKFYELLIKREEEISIETEKTSTELLKEVEELENIAEEVVENKEENNNKTENSNENEEQVMTLQEYISKNFVGIEKKLLEWISTFYNTIKPYFILKLKDLIVENIPEEYEKIIYELFNTLGNIQFNKKTGKIKEQSFNITLRKVAELLEAEKSKLKSLEDALLKGLTTDLTPEVLQDILQKQLKEKEVLFKEDFEEEFYKIKLIPFIKIEKLKVEDSEEDFLIVKHLEYYYGVISNKYILIKKGINKLKKVFGNEQVILVNEKILNIIDYQNNFLILKYVKRDDGNEEYEIKELKKDFFDEVKSLLKRVAISENLINTKIGFYFKEGKLKANYVKGYGKIKHGEIEFDLGSPISLRYSDSKSESLFYDYYSFINSEKFFEEKPPLYEGLLEIFNKLKQENDNYLKPFLITLGFTFGSIYIETFKKEEALFPALYFYGLKGTGKSLLLKLSRAILGVDDNRVCSSFAQFRDLLSTSNNISYLDEIPKDFDKKSEGKELLKNLLTNIKVEHRLSGKESDIFVMKGTFFATTNYPIEETFGLDEALEERLIFINFNYDNKIKESLAEKLNQLIENVKHKPLSPTEKGYTYLSNVIFLYYQLIKKDLFKETKIKEIIKKIKGFLEPIIKTKKINDYPRFRALVLPLFFGLYVFSKIVDNEEIFNFVKENAEELIDYILKEHPSYSFNIKETLYQEFVKYVGNFWRLVDLGYFSIIEKDEEEPLVIDNKELKRSLISKLKKENLTEITFVMKKGDDYYILLREEILKNFFKLVKEFYNFKKLTELKAELSKIGIKEIKIVRPHKKLVYFDLENKKIYIQNLNTGEQVRFKLVRIPKFLIEDLDNLLVNEIKVNNQINTELKLKTGKQITLKEFFEKLTKIKEELKEDFLELRESNENKEDTEEEFEL